MRAPAIRAIVLATFALALGWSDAARTLRAQPPVPTARPIEEDAAALRTPSPRPPVPAPTTPAPQPIPIPIPTAPAHTLSLDDLEQMALQSNPTLEQAVLRVAEARHRAYQSGLPPNPEIAWDHDDINEDGTLGEHGPFMDLPIITAGKLRINRDRFSVEGDQAEWLALAQQYRVINGVRRRYFQLLALQTLLELHAAMVRSADHIVRITQEKVETEHAERPDLLTARVEARRLRLAWNTLHHRYRETWHELAAFLGVPDLPPTPLSGRLDAARPVSNWHATLAHLMEASPEIRAAELRVRREQLTVRLERAQVVPDLIVRFGYNFDHTVGQFTPLYRLTLVDVPIWNWNRGNIREAEANLRYHRRDVDRVRLGLQQRLARAFAHYHASLDAVREYQEHILPEAREAYELYLELFREEEENYSRVQSSQNTYFEAYGQYIEALLALRQSEVMIHGLLLSDGLDEPPQPPGSGRPTRMPNP